MKNDPATALVLSGGGARGAYQVGVLRGLLDLGVQPAGFDILVGSSAGSINAGVLASRAENYAKAIDVLERLWRHLEADQVFRTDARSLGSTGVRWAWDLTFGGVLGRVTPKSLLDTAPLRRLLERHIPFRQIDANIEKEALHSLVIAATDLHTADGVLFLQTRAEIALWKRRRWRIEPTRIRCDHLLASSAIPILFPSVRIDGRHFADGCIRNTSPLRPAIHLGADRIVAIGVSGPRQGAAAVPSALGPSIAQVAGVLLDAVMLDAIEVDVEHTDHVNTSVIACSTTSENPFRWVDVLWLTPSADVSAMAAELEDRIPVVVRYLMRGLGTDESLTELASYLLFDSVYCNRLIDLGRADVAAARDRIASFFLQAPNRPATRTPASDDGKEDDVPSRE